MKSETVTGYAWAILRGAIAGLLVGIPLALFQSRCSAQTYGNATPGTFGEPSIVGVGSATPGGRVDVHLQDSIGNADAWILVGQRSRGLTPWGLWLNVAPIATVHAVTHIWPGIPSVAWVEFPIPNDSALRGLVVHFQWVILDPQGPGGTSGTRGLRVQIRG